MVRQHAPVAAGAACAGGRRGCGGGRGLAADFRRAPCESHVPPLGPPPPPEVTNGLFAEWFPRGDMHVVFWCHNALAAGVAVHLPNVRVHGCGRARRAQSLSARSRLHGGCGCGTGNLQGGVRESVFNPLRCFARGVLAHFSRTVSGRASSCAGFACAAHPLLEFETHRLAQRRRFLALRVHFFGKRSLRKRRCVHPVCTSRFRAQTQWRGALGGAGNMTDPISLQNASGPARTFGSDFGVSRWGRSRGGPGQARPGLRR